MDSDAFARWLVTEPPECRRQWHLLDRLAARSGTRTVDLLDRHGRGDLPPWTADATLIVVRELDRLGSIGRLRDWADLRDQVDGIDGHGDTVIGVFGPTNDKEQ